MWAVLTLAAIIHATLPHAAGQTSQAAVGPYYGQRLPGSKPGRFLADVAGPLGIAKAPIFSADGGEMIWARSTGRHASVLMTSRRERGSWALPQPVPFSTGEFFDHNPAMSRDGRRLIFASNRPIPGKAQTTLPGTDVPASDLWMSEREGGAWLPPTALGPPINTGADEDCPVLAADDTLYFSSSRATPTGAPGGILRARAAKGGFAEPERLPAPVSDAGEMVSGIAPDNSYILFYSMKSGEAGGLCLSFRQADGSWSPPARLVPLLGGLRPYAASVTMDGRWLLLTVLDSKGAALYWVDSAILDAARTR